MFTNLQRCLTKAVLLCFETYLDALKRNVLIEQNNIFWCKMFIKVLEVDNEHVYNYLVLVFEIFLKIYIAIKDDVLVSFSIRLLKIILLSRT